MITVVLFMVWLVKFNRVSILILRSLTQYSHEESNKSVEDTLLPNGVKVAVKMYRLLNCLYKRNGSILAFLRLFKLTRLDTFVV